MNEVEIRKSRIQGKGIFALKDFKRGETITKIEGPVIRYPTKPNWRIVRANWSIIGPNRYKIPYSKNPGNFVNHSCAPNAISVGDKIIGLKHIASGEEITIDYSTTERLPGWRMHCNCKSKTCRKTIQSIGFLPEPLFKKYEKYLPAFLKKEYLSQKVYVVKGQDVVKGNGTGMLRAKRAIRKGEIVFTVEGPLISYPKKPNWWLGWQWFSIAKNTWMIALPDNPWWSVRHSCDPNVGVKNRTDIVAMRPIRKDEEITIDNSTIETDPKCHLKCSCGSPKCRGVIRSIHYLPPALFKKYRPYIAPFLRKEYLRAYNSSDALHRGN